MPDLLNFNGYWSWAEANEFAQYIVTTGLYGRARVHKDPEQGNWLVDGLDLNGGLA